MQFGEEIKDIAGLIVNQLLEGFQRYSDAGTKEKFSFLGLSHYQCIFVSAASDDDDSAFAATECLETIATVVEVICTVIISNIVGNFLLCEGGS